ncbi:MAG TPA: hypothetical protein VK392_02095 [Thermoanaerobaculia bacterium]|jgi:hypothetical protein|nr:hypothetical protein [Thermoanaerobaculia bacterium]
MTASALLPGSSFRLSPEAPVPPEPPESRTLDDDGFDALRRHGVTPEYVRGIAALGYERADPDDILSLKIART